MRRRSSSIRAALPAKLLMQPGETRQHILQICGFHLQPRLPRARPLRENPQNQRGAVDDLPVERVHQILHLHRRERVVEQNHVRLLHFSRRPDLLYFARSDVGAGIDRAAVLHKRIGHLHPGGLRKRLHLSHGFVKTGIRREAHTGQNCFFRQKETSNCVLRFNDVCPLSSVPPAQFLILTVFTQSSSQSSRLYRCTGD